MLFIRRNPVIGISWTLFLMRNWYVLRFLCPCLVSRFWSSHRSLDFVRIIFPKEKNSEMCSCICLWQVSETFSRYTIIHHCLTVRVIAKRYRHKIEQMYRLSTNYITVFVKTVPNNNNGRNGSCLTWLATSLEEKRRWLIINASPRGQCYK